MAASPSALALSPTMRVFLVPSLEFSLLISRLVLLVGGSFFVCATGAEADTGAARGRLLLQPALPVLLGRAAPSMAGARHRPSSPRRRLLQGASAPA